jgi:hypothetical protein
MPQTVVSSSWLLVIEVQGGTISVSFPYTLNYPIAFTPGKNPSIATNNGDLIATMWSYDHCTIQRVGGSGDSNVSWLAAGV